MYDYGARWYDPAVARWNAVDPLASSYAPISTYAYVANNPIAFIDPDGMFISSGGSGITLIGMEAQNLVRDLQVGMNLNKEISGASSGSDNDSRGPTIISRDDWGAKAPITQGRSWENINSNLSVYYNAITIHNSGNADNYLTIQKLQDKEQAAGYADISYHFAIDRYGNIYEGRPINIKGAHVKGANTGNIGIVLLADLSTDNARMSGPKKAVESVLGNGKLTSPMLQSTLDLTKHLNQTYGIQKFGGHNETIPNRHCPGNLFTPYINDFRRMFKFREP